MLADLFAPVTPDNFNALLDQRAVFVIDGVLFQPAMNDAGRPVWRGANGHVIRHGDMDDVFDGVIERGARMSYLLGR
jgi:hypothetical protein